MSDNDQLSAPHKLLLDFVKKGDFDGAYVVAFKINSSDNATATMEINSSGFTLKDDVYLDESDLEQVVSAALYIAMRTCMQAIGEAKTKQVIIHAAAAQYEEEQQPVH